MARSSPQLPGVTLALMLFSAGAVLVLGMLLSREKKEVAVEQDRTSLTEFAGHFLREIDSLERLYEDRLLDFRDRLGGNASSIAINAEGRRLVGIEQVTVFPEEGAPRYYDLREGDRSEPLPEPRRSGESRRAGSSAGIGGLMVNLTDFVDPLLEPYRWIEQPRHPPHFLTRLNGDTILLLRIDRDAAAEAARSWLTQWMADSFAGVEAAGIAARVHAPSGDVFVASGQWDEGEHIDFLLPVESLFGNWKLTSQTPREVIVVYRQPVLVGAGVLSVILALAGGFVFQQQRRALRLAAQRVSFVNRVSHELRTPMMNILLNADLLSDPSYGDKGRRNRRIGLIREEAARLSRLLENVLCFSRREKARHHPEESATQELRIAACGVDETVDTVLTQFDSVLRRSGIKVVRNESERGAMVLADRDAFVQVLGNLISNVEKYASGGGVLEIEVSSEKSSGVSLSIRDRGPGIPPAERERIFQPFARVHDSTREGVSGTGLGLAIARDLAEAMGGALRLREIEGPGACFELSLPRAADNIVEMAG